MRTVALFNWMEDQGIGCPAGEVWSAYHGKCIPKAVEADPNAGWLGQTGAAIGNQIAGASDWLGRCQPGFRWSQTEQRCIEISSGVTDTREDISSGSTGREIYEYHPNFNEVTTTDPKDGLEEDLLTQWEPPPSVIPEEPVVGETPTQLYDLDNIITSLQGWLTADASQATEDAYWETKMTRLNEQYERAKQQKMEDLNVKGLYYSGMRDTALDEMEEDYFRVVAEEEAKFQHERFNRDVQRYTMAMQYSLGARAQEIDWAYKRGALTLQQLDLALQETLGISALELQDKGMLLDYMLGMYNVGISQETNDIARQQMWLNTVSLLYQLGVSEAEIDTLYQQISGAPSQPAV